MGLLPIEVVNGCSNGRGVRRPRGPGIVQTLVGYHTQEDVLYGCEEVRNS